MFQKFHEQRETWQAIAAKKTQRRERVGRKKNKAGPVQLAMIASPPQSKTRSVSFNSQKPGQRAREIEGEWRSRERERERDETGLREMRRSESTFSALWHAADDMQTSFIIVSFECDLSCLAPEWTSCLQLRSAGYSDDLAYKLTLAIKTIRWNRTLMCRRNNPKNEPQKSQEQLRISANIWARDLSTLR